MYTPAIRNFSGPKSHQVTCPDGTILYFSYETLIGFIPRNSGQVIALRNYWAQTTGGHLNEIEPDKDKRLTNEEFEIALKKYFEKA